MKPKKEKNKISKLIEKSDSETDENEHELSFYLNDRVKLMKEVLKIIKQKKIKSMAPDCIKDLDIEEINSMLLEELLGISNKRLKYIFDGQSLNEDSSSTDPEEEKQPIDIISLDDVSDDDFIIEVDSGKSKKKKHGKVKEEPKTKRIKKERRDKEKQPLQEENLMSVLELLELQARARAIRSQLTLEANKKNSQPPEINISEDSDDDAVIIEVCKNEEIVINLSDSENESKKKSNTEEKSASGEGETQKKKITLIRDRFTKQKTPEEDKEEGEITENKEVTNEKEKSDEENIKTNQSEMSESNNSTSNEQNKEKTNLQESECARDEDEIILIVDQEEMDGIIGD